MRGADQEERHPDVLGPAGLRGTPPGPGRSWARKKSGSPASDAALDDVPTRMCCVAAHFVSTCTALTSPVIAANHSTSPSWTGALLGGIPDPSPSRPPVARPSRSIHEGFRRPPLPVARRSRKLGQTAALGAMPDECRELPLEQRVLTRFALHGNGQHGRGNWRRTRTLEPHADLVVDRSSGPVELGGERCVPEAPAPNGPDPGGSDVVVNAETSFAALIPSSPQSRRER